MDTAAVVSMVVKQIGSEAGIEGAFLAGSAAGKSRDEYSDVDICIATADTLKDLRKAYGLREDIFNAVGQPLSLMELELEHAKLTGAVYGKSLFPPVGLRVDLVFCQLKYAAEQMPHSEYQLLFDRSGLLKTALAKRAARKPKDEIEQELRQRLAEFSFYLHGAACAFGRNDRASIHTQAEQLRVAIYGAAAVRAGSYAHGAKRGLAHLTPDEKWVLEHSYHPVTRRTIRQLIDLYVACLTDIQAEYGLEDALARFEQSLPELF